jgi:hypothetical protein
MRRFLIFVIITSSASAVTLIWQSCSSRVPMGECESINALPHLEPDYTQIIIPPNIGPMNFVIKEKGDEYVVKVFSDSDDSFEIHSSSPAIIFPVSKWKRIIEKNPGGQVSFQIYTREKGKKWQKYGDITNHIAQEPIDRYLVYRYFRPNYYVLKEMIIYQRDLENGLDSIVLTNKTLFSCINCHNFCNNDPTNMILHIRWGPAAGTLLIQDGRISKIDTKTDFSQAPASYPSWHPSAKLIAFSVNVTKQFFHAKGQNRDVIDLNSDLVIYKVNTNTITTTPEISRAGLAETFPTWSPDGTCLYFSRAPELKQDQALEDQYQNLKSDIMRISYNADTDTWGQAETVVSAAETGKSSTQARISPDGRFMLFVMCEYGNFPIFRPDSDLYLMNLIDGGYRRLDISSSSPEGFHSWSRNSRWIVFSSKRDNGLYTRLYFSHIDAQGNASKPFILPLKDPEEYQTMFYVYNVPEFATKPIPLDAHQLIDTAMDPRYAKKAILDERLDSSKHTVTGQAADKDNSTVGRME